ncbi:MULTISPECIES: hypothetical protein [unclassified Mesorhizobium]|uniref:hypothetical protein n=1 Tax=unclassified Mesorhizobium TaxID=325217 RepID=UPI00142EB80C|nr:MULTISPECIES: hypothetical protein [unclassified Mesorhizobium]
MFDYTEIAREFRYQSEWERRLHDYEMLIIAGVSDEEALRVATQTAEDRAALRWVLHAA